MQAPHALQERFYYRKTDFELNGDFSKAWKSFSDKMTLFSKNPHDTKKIIFEGDEDIIWREFTIIMSDYKNFCEEICGGQNLFIDRIVKEDISFPVLTDISYVNKPVSLFTKIKRYLKEPLSDKVLYMYEQMKTDMNTNPNVEFGIRHDALKANKDLTTDDINTLIDEFLKYMAIVMCSPSKPMGMMSEKVDLIWHIMISRTKTYRDFCMLYGTYIQHNAGDSKTIQSDEDNYVRMLKIYIKNFGKPDLNCWSVPSSILSKNSSTRRKLSSGSVSTYDYDNDTSNNSSFFTGLLFGDALNSSEASASPSYSSCSSSSCDNTSSSSDYGSSSSSSCSSSSCSSSSSSCSSSSCSSSSCSSCSSCSS